MLPIGYTIVKRHACHSFYRTVGNGTKVWGSQHIYRLSIYQHFTHCTHVGLYTLSLFSALSSLTYHLIPYKKNTVAKRENTQYKTSEPALRSLAHRKGLERGGFSFFLYITQLCLASRTFFSFLPHFNSHSSSLPFTLHSFFFFIFSMLSFYLTLLYPPSTPFSQLSLFSQYISLYASAKECRV